MATVAQIRAELDALGVEHPSGARKAELARLLVAADRHGASEVTREAAAEAGIDLAEVAEPTEPDPGGEPVQAATPAAGRQLRPTGTPELPAGRHPLPPEAIGQRPRVTRRQRLQAQPPVDPVLVDRAEVRRRYALQAEGLTLVTPPTELTRERPTDDGA